MSNRLSVAAFLFLVALCSGCSAMSNGLLAVEANTILYDDLRAADPVAGSTFDSHDVNVDSIGLLAAFNTPLFDIIGGVEERKYNGEKVPEACLGLRWRFLSLATIQPYLDAKLRHGFGLETGSGKEDYEGAAIGGGAIWQFSDHWFFDLNLEYESTLSDIDMGSGNTSLDGVVGRVGFGFSL